MHIAKEDLYITVRYMHTTMKKLAYYTVPNLNNHGELTPQFNACCTRTMIEHRYLTIPILMLILTAAFNNEMCCLCRYVLYVSTSSARSVDFFAMSIKVWEFLRNNCYTNRRNSDLVTVCRFCRPRQNCSNSRNSRTLFTS